MSQALGYISYFDLKTPTLVKLTFPWEIEDADDHSTKVTALVEHFLVLDSAVSTLFSLI